MQAAFVSVDEAAQYLNLPRSTVYDLIAKGQFPVPVQKFGRRILVNKAALEALSGVAS